MRRTIRTVAIGVAVIAAVALVPMAPTSAAAAKVGQKCTKVGQKSGTLVCTKVGTKLTYQRPAATPAPTVTAAPVTTPAAGGTPTTAVAATAAPLPNSTNLQRDPANVKKGGTLNYMAGEVLSLDPSRYPGVARPASPTAPPSSTRCCASTRTAASVRRWRRASPPLTMARRGS